MTVCVMSCVWRQRHIFASGSRDIPINSAARVVDWLSSTLMYREAPSRRRHIREELVMSDQSSTDHPIEKSAIEARQGATPGVLRWVLAISLFGTIVALAVAYLFVHGV
jgi:hypothetical protein